MTQVIRSLEPAELVAAMKWRYATKVFDPSRVIPDADLDALEQALVLTASSFGLQPWRFVFVRDPGVRAKLLPHSWNQKQVVDCSHHVVLAARKGLATPEIDRFVARTAEVQGKTAESLAGFRKMMVGHLVEGKGRERIDEWAGDQVYLALGTLLTAAAVLGIDACPMEGIAPPKYDEVLGLPAEGYRTVVACSLGYRSASDDYARRPKVRFSREDVIRRV